MSMSRRVFCSAGLAGLGLTAAGGEVEPPRVETLESGLGDVVRVKFEPHFEAGAEDVVLCLVNRMETGATGFDIRRGAAPRYIAAPDEAVCTRVVPGRHALTLWRTVGGELQPVIQAPLDLSHSAGARTLIIWPAAAQ